MSTSRYGKSIDVVFVDRRRRIGICSFHKIEDIDRDSCILYSKMLWGILLNGFASFNAMGIPKRFDLIVLVA
jgi:hypothetical protein